MTDRCLSAASSRLLLVLGASLMVALPAQTQSLRPTSQLDSLRASSPSSGARAVDYIVALVNSEPLTNNEVRSRLLRAEQQLAQQGAVLPPRAELARQVTEQLINERIQLQRAAEIGMQVDDATLERAEQSIAAQNQIGLEEFRRRIVADGMDLSQLRRQLREQILLQRLREREVESRVQVNENDIDAFVQEQKSISDLSQLELNLAHILVPVPEGASAEQVRGLQARAQRAADRARKGEDFASLAREYSEAPEGKNGGQFGMRPASRLPELFVGATRNLRAGDIAGPLQSPAGFHVLQLVDKRQAGLPDVDVTQTRARHILLRPGPQLSQSDARDRLARWRQEIQAGKADFEALAREHSQDGSAQGGGDLGWASPGQFVPEFEEAMNRLAPGEVSAPVVSRFGVHLIRVDERRRAQLSEREQRELVRGLVRERKAAEFLQNWAQDLRSRAYVEYRDAPQI